VYGSHHGILRYAVARGPRREYPCPSRSIA
jgi:hypothetical protein